MSCVRGLSPPAVSGFQKRFPNEELPGVAIVPRPLILVLSTLMGVMPPVFVLAQAPMRVAGTSANVASAAACRPAALKARADHAES